MPGVEHDVPAIGELGRAGGSSGVVSRRDVSSQPVDEFAVSQPPGWTLVTLTSVSDDLGDDLTLVWEVEPGREVLRSGRKYKKWCRAPGPDGSR